MARSNADLLALKAEITNDPTGLGLTAPPAIDDVGNADKLNLVRSELQIEREAIPASEIARAIDRVEYGSVALSDRQWIDMNLATGLVDARTGSVFRTGVLAIFGAQTATRANMQALLTVDGNRIDKLFQAGTLEAGGTVTPSDIANARNAT